MHVHLILKLQQINKELKLTNIIFHAIVGGQNDEITRSSSWRDYNKQTWKHFAPLLPKQLHKSMSHLCRTRPQLCMISSNQFFSLFAQCHFIHGQKFVCAEKAAELGIKRLYTHAYVSLLPHLLHRAIHHELHGLVLYDISIRHHPSKDAHA